jgi:DNA-binding IclR family transcriptional regulator
MNEYFQNQLPRYTEYTITDIEKLRAELQKTIQRGYATGIEELEIGLTAVAAPIRNHTGQVVAALSVSGPSYRLPIKRLEEVSKDVIESAHAISAELGYIDNAYTQNPEDHP